MRLVVSNTGPLLHLIEAQALDLLKLTRLETKIACISWRQLAENTDFSSVRLHENFVSSVLTHDAQALAWAQAGLLDPGEAEALALAQQLSADWFLTDDAAARVLATSLKIEAHGSLGIVLWAAANGHSNRDEAADVLDRLAQTSLWVSVHVLAEARDALNKLFPTANP